MVKKCEEIREQGKKIGTVGAVLLYSNGTVQHYGIKRFKRGFTHIGLRKELSHAMDNFKQGEYIGNTFAFCLIPRETWEDVGGLNEGYEICFEDVEFNLHCLKSGYHNIMSRATCFHYESQTRGKKTSREDVKRIQEYWKEMFNKDE